ncbi:MAG: T9SS type A sorting domain-containing protein [Candidatus Marinimicrobia bacterium]|nr:T9SS type A sorting domain-containing protein [Candidatus Neomarinimicrobiota bacterium]
MKKTIVLLVLTSVLIPVISYANWGMFDADRSWITINENGTSNSYTLWNSATGTFDSHGFGTYSSGNTFQITAFDVKTYKNSGSNVTGCEYFYRVYKQGSTAPNFTSLGGGWLEDISGGDQKWGAEDLTVDLLSSVNSSGTWVIEIYGQVTGTSPDETQYDNNGVSEGKYSATFNADSSLPVELSSFNTRSTTRGVELTWTTDSEIENQGFIISRKSAASPWSEISSFTTNKTLEGQGSTTQATDYSFIDTRVEEGVTYSYRLSDVDYKGTQTDHIDLIQEITYVSPATATRPGVFELTGLYPNPFNPSITLSYDLAKVSDLHVSIYSMKGELVWNYTQGSHPAGQNYTLDWNGTDLSGGALSSGIYLVSIQAGEQNLTRKVTLLR